MYPGAGSSTLNYQVKNGGSGYQQLQTVTAAVVADGSGNVEQNGVSKAGCLASWFAAHALTVGRRSFLIASASL